MVPMFCSYSILFPISVSGSFDISVSNMEFYIRIDLGKIIVL